MFGTQNVGVLFFKNIHLWEKLIIKKYLIYNLSSVTIQTIIYATDVFGGLKINRNIFKAQCVFKLG